MLTLGVDLAAEPKTTAAALLDWQPGTARVTELLLPADDDAILDLAWRADRLGIDCPLGWPDAFISFVTAQQTGSLTLPSLDSARWRRTLSYRLTDEHVRAELGMIPLSVATDRIGVTAMRAARLQTLLAERGHSIDRTGAGFLVEVYPAAGLRCWELPYRGYKGSDNRPKRELLVDQLCAAAPWLDLGGTEQLCRAYDHALDAVIAAMLARAAALGRTIPPPAELRDAAGREGWIAIPACSLTQLASADAG